MTRLLRCVVAPSPCILVALTAGCQEPLPSGLGGTWDYEAVFETTILEAEARISRQDGDSIFGTFSDKNPDPETVAQYGNSFCIAGVVRGDHVTFAVSAPGIGIVHDGVRDAVGISGTCEAGVVDDEHTYPCTFNMTPR